MLPYYILIFIPILIYLLGKIKRKNGDKLSLIAFFTILILMLSLRSINCGIDLKMYSGFYKIFAMSSFEKAVSVAGKGEILYYFLNKFVSLLGGDFQFFLFIVALLSITPIAVYYYKESENGLLTIALFLIVAPFSMFFSGLRQAIAMGIIIFAFRFIKNKKIVKYIVCVVIAMYFHKSASICLLLYPIYHAKITKNWLYIIFPIMLCIFIFNKQIFTFVLHYYNPIYEDSYGGVTSTGEYAILILLILFIIYCFIFPDKNKINEDFIGLRNFLIFSTIIQLFVPINYIVMRMNYYSLLFIPVLISKVSNIGYEKNKNIIKLSVIVMTTFFIIYFFYNGYKGDDILQIFPYIPFWKS